MLKLVHDAAADAVDDPETMTVGLDELCRVAAQEMLTVALLAERRAYLDAHADVLDEGGRRMVVGGPEDHGALHHVVHDRTDGHGLRAVAGHHRPRDQGHGRHVGLPTLAATVIIAVITIVATSPPTSAASRSNSTIVITTY